MRVTLRSSSASEIIFMDPDEEEEFLDLILNIWHCIMIIREEG